jgi:Tol biopolymer transport system component
MVDFSPTGEWMTYVTYPKAVLWRSKLDGSQQLQLSPVGMQVHLPRWSPDARLIAFSGKESRRRWRIYTVSAEGGDPQPLLSEYRTAADVNWSPDGNRLIFAPFPWMEDPAGVHISVVDLRDKQVSTIPAPEGLYSPRWSPDGNFILALGRSKQLMLGNLITQQWAEIDHGPTAFPQWSRDGKFLYFLRVMGDVGIFRMRLADRKAERVVEMKAIQSVSYWFGLTPDGSVLMMRELGSEEIYALDLAR